MYYTNQKSTQAVRIMLINFSFNNVNSFKDTQSLSMEISTLDKDQILLDNTTTLETGDNLLKSSLIYGANASGKTNIIKNLECFKRIVLSSYKDLEDDKITYVIPFLLDMNNVNNPSVFEIVFVENNIKYRYGIAVYEGILKEEWLYFTQKRETMLFHRVEQKIEYNKSSFDEAKLFIKTDNKNGVSVVEKTAPQVPFVSVLSAFQGKHSLNVIAFFKRVHHISGIADEQLGGYTFNLFKNDKNFQEWVLNILKDFGISGLIVKEQEVNQKIQLPASDNGQEIIMNEISFQHKGLVVSVKKYMNNSEEQVEFPLELESSGTKKIIHLLGPIYDVIKTDKIVFIDEFDSKFHTLLSKHILKIFHKYCKNSQLVANVQDTQLMDTSLFRRDQIWFVHKDSIMQNSQLYSLSDYKIAIKDLYTQDYLDGSFDAIPLFSSLDDVNSLMEL